MQPFAQTVQLPSCCIALANLPNPTPSRPLVGNFPSDLQAPQLLTKPVKGRDEDHDQHITDCGIPIPRSPPKHPLSSRPSSSSIARTHRDAPPAHKPGICAEAGHSEQEDDHALVSQFIPWTTQTPRAEGFPSMGCYLRDLGSRHGAHEAFFNSRQHREHSWTQLQLSAAICNALGVFRKMPPALLSSKASHIVYKWFCEITLVLLNS